MTGGTPLPSSPEASSVKSAVDRQIVASTGWIAASYGARNLLSILTVVVLARLVTPADFGLVALASPLLLAVELMQEAGIGAALIFRKKHTAEAEATAVAFYLLASAICALMIVFAASPVAALLGHDELAPILRVLAVVPLCRGLMMVPLAVLERELGFRSLAKVEVSAGLTQLVVAASMGVANCGVWSLVGGQVAAALVQAAATWKASPARFSVRGASWPIYRELATYGRSVGAANVVTLATNSVDSLIVGRALGTTPLGYYNQSFRLGTLPSNLIGYIVGRTMFPVYARSRHDVDRMRELYTDNLVRIALFSFPVSVFLYFASAPIVETMLGSEWRPAIGILEVIAVYGFIKSFVAPSGEFFKGIGRPSLALAASALFLALLIPSLIIAVDRFGARGAAWALIGALLFSYVPALWVSLRLCNLRVAVLARAVAPMLCVSASLGIVLFAVRASTEQLPPLLSLVALSAAGVLGYAAATWAFARREVAPFARPIAERVSRVRGGRVTPDSR